MIDLPENARMQDYQAYIHDLEALYGWLGLDLVHNCFMMGEEVGELFKAVREVNQLADASDVSEEDERSAAAHVGEEIVDVLNYLLAIANRLQIDVEQAFRDKNARNQKRTWKAHL